MKILSFNYRGIGKKAKRREIKEMLRKVKVDFCCIQETKLENLRERTARSIWGFGNSDWTCMDAQGKSGGILSIWNVETFCKTSARFANGVLVVNGYLKEDGS